MAYFADFFKALFTKLGSKSSNNYGTASNTGVALLNMSDMSAKGGMDLTTLGQVLGGQLFFYARNITQSGSAISDYVTEPIYRCGSSSIANNLTDKPNNDFYAFMLFNFYPYSNQSYMVQLIITTDAKMWIRRRTNIATEAAIWGEWASIV